MVFELTPPTRLGRTVVFGYCDIAAGGIRALEGLSARPGATANCAGESPRDVWRETERERLVFSGMREPVFKGLPAFEAVHYEAESDSNNGEPKSDTLKQTMTLLKLNSEVWQELAAPVAMAIVDLLAAQNTALVKVVIVAAVQPPKRKQVASATVIPSNSVCAFTDLDSRGNGTKKENTCFPLLPVGLTSLPPGARIADLFLTTLIRLCQLEELPLLVLARRGYRATGAKAEEDGTDEAIKDLGECLSDVVGLKFDIGKACQVTGSKGWQGTRPGHSIVPGYM